MVTGNYIDMKPKYHMAIFPHQFGLLSVIHLIFSLFGAWHYEVFQYLNALCMPLLFYSGYKFLEIICDTAEVILYYAVFSWDAFTCFVLTANCRSFGGFLFSAVCESGSRYVIPYVVYMILLAAVGMCLLTRLLAEKIPGRTFL